MEYSSNNEGNGSQVQNRKVSVRSVTIKQFQEAPDVSDDSPLLIDNAPVDILRFVVIVRKIDVEATKVTLSVQDTTGSLENVRQWINSDGGEPHEPNYSVGDYVALYCSTRKYNERRLLNITRVDPEISLSFVFFHQICVLREHWHYTGSKPLGAVQEPKPKAESSLFVDDAPPEAKNSLSARILNALKSEPDGLHVRFLSQNLGIDELQILQECESLNNAGLVYQTDDNTYASSTT